MANNFYGANLRCYGIGNFDLTKEEFADVLMILFNSDTPAIETMRKYKNCMMICFIKELE